MSRKEFILSSCAGKVRFETFEQAAGVVRARNHAGKIKGARAAYRCKVCRGFHVGASGDHRRRKMKS